MFPDSFLTRCLLWLLRIAAVLAVLAVAIGGVLWWLGSPPTTAREALFTNGQIITMTGSVAEAVHVVDGRIVAVGERSLLESKLGAGAEIVDLQGGTLLPGLIEPHTHPIASAMLGAAVDVSGFTHNSRAEVMQTLRETADGNALTDWTIAFGWDPVMVADLEPPTLAELDAISPDRPLLILTQMMHDAYVNSAGLLAAGINQQTESPPGGEFLRDADGSLNGTIRELSAINRVVKAIPRPPEGITALLVNQQLNRYASAGYTSIGALGLVGRAEDPVNLLRGLVDQPDAPVRAVVWGLPKQVNVKRGPSYGKRFSLRGVKFWMDGSPFAGGAAMAEPYENSELVLKRLELPADHSPELNHEQQHFAEQFQAYHDAGFDIAVHVQGERAVQRVLDIAGPILAASSRQQHRHRLEHNALITKAQLQQVKALGFSLSFFVDHIRFYGDQLPDLVGQQRLQRYMPVANAVNAGVSTSLHGDHPATPVNALRVLSTAVNRRSSSNKPVGPEQRVGVMQALRAMTVDAAWQLGLEDEVGTIEVGKAADFVWLSANPGLVKQADLQQITVKGTWVYGQPVDTRSLSRRNLRLAWSLLGGK